ncbi:MAG: hypothetical protein WC629_02795 [Candidatus Paceibacterota bacterium]|jgi:hypothetical protein
MKKTLILQIKNGGMGDHLFHSHIPRIAKETGAYERVFISNKSELRNSDYKTYFWEKNPFVDGFIDEEGVSVSFTDIPEGQNILDHIMLLLGLDDGKRFHEPEIYFKPNKIPWLEDKTLYDPNYISNAGKLTGPKIEKYFKDHNIKIDYQMKIRAGNSLPITSFDSYLECTNSHQSSFLNFIDVIYSVKELYSVVTGTATLACALGRKDHVFYTKDQHPMFRHSKLNTYIEL